MDNILLYYGDKHPFISVFENKTIRIILSTKGKLKKQKNKDGERVAGGALI